MKTTARLSSDQRPLANGRDHRLTHRCAFVLALAMALACLRATVAEAQTDRIYGDKGSPVAGAITKMTENEVTATTRGGEVTVPVKEIKKIAFDDEPRELTGARDRALNGQFEDALRDLRAIDASRLTRSVVKQELDYYLAFVQAKLALAGQGDPTQAGGLLFTFTKDYPASYHFYEANELIGDLFSAMGRYDNAARFYGNLRQAPWPEYKMRGAVLEADALRRKGDFGAAMQLYESATSAAPNDPVANRLKLMATLGKAQCLSMAGKPDEGVALVEEIIATNDAKTDIELFARAYNALGACHLKAQRSEEALLAYLHTHLLFFQQPDLHAEAIYHLVSLWEEQRQPQRALEARQLLKERYNTTAWAARL